MATEEYLRWTYDDGHVQVYRDDGSLQCEPGSGPPPAAMAERLGSAGITVHGSGTGHDGLSRAAVCGAPTGRINVFDIDAADLDAALGLGFRPLP
jgi:hypothetical protein